MIILSQLYTPLTCENSHIEGHATTTMDRVCGVRVHPSLVSISQQRLRVAKPFSHFVTIAFGLGLLEQKQA